MKYRLIAADFDGTLLNERKQVTARVRQAIAQAQQMGVYFVPATGRPVPGLIRYAESIRWNAPAILYNGAMLYDPRKDEILYEQKLSAQAAGLVMQLADVWDTTMCIWSENRLYGDLSRPRLHQYKWLSELEPLQADPALLLQQGITKILLSDTPERIGTFQQELRKLQLHGEWPELAFCTSNPSFLELYSSRVSKGAALLKVGELLGVAPGEMIAIGDGFNDRSMLECAAVGIAMGNAPEQLKQFADDVTASNEEDGVARAIEKYCLGSEKEAR